MRLTHLRFAALYALFAVGLALGQDKPVSIETIERIKHATVPIVCGALTKEGTFSIKKIIGSAFLINDEGYFLTAGHVFNDWDKITKGQQDVCFPSIYIPIGGWQTLNPVVRWFRFDSCIKNDGADIAVCKPTENPFLREDLKKQITFLSFGSFLGRKDGTPIAFTGFPLESLRPVTSKGNIASYVETDNAIVIDKAAWPGASGSPIYLFDGTVIGVVIKRGINEGSGLAYARPAESVIEFLTKNKIRFQQKK